MDGEYLCSYGDCVVGEVCDGVAQCIDGSDETQEACQSDLAKETAARREYYSPIQSACRYSLEMLVYWTKKTLTYINISGSYIPCAKIIQKEYTLLSRRH